jgi:hypothetical protein
MVPKGPCLFYMNIKLVIKIALDSMQKSLILNSNIEPNQKRGAA